MKNTLKILTITLGAILALILTRMGISYLLVLIALGLIISYLTENKTSAILSGILYATIGYIISYPSGLFLINYMPTSEIPITVSSTEIIFNLLIGLLVPIIIATIICYISSIIGIYIKNIIKKQNKEEHQKEEFEYHFESIDDFNEDYEEISNENYGRTMTPSRKKLAELSPIQRAKNKRKYKKE